MWKGLLLLLQTPFLTSRSRTEISIMGANTSNRSSKGSRCQVLCALRKSSVHSHSTCYTDWAPDGVSTCFYSQHLKQQHGPSSPTPGLLYLFHMRVTVSPKGI